MALKAVYFDVGETLVDEERWWRVLAQRSALQPHVIWAALGVTIERGEEHDALWEHLGIDRPDGCWQDLSYELDDLYPDATACLEGVRALGLLIGIVGNQTAALERWVRDARLPADVVSSSASLGVRKPDRRFFERIVELAGCASAEVAYVGDRVDNDVLPRCGGRARRSPRQARAVGKAAADATRGRARPRRPRAASAGASLARVSDLRVGIGYDAHAFEDGIPLVLGGVEIMYPRGLAGHSDGDVVSHALIDALLGAADLGDIGSFFPSSDDQYRGASSLDLLWKAYREVRDAGWRLVNADCVLIGETPHIETIRAEMSRRLSRALGVEDGLVSVRATTTDGLGFTGRGEGLAAQAVALLRR